MKKALLVIAQEGYQDHELAGTREGLEKAGYDVVLASRKVGECTGKLGGKEVASVGLADVSVREYDRIAFIGGPGMAEYTDDQEALRVARDAAEFEMPLGAICIAPTVLASAGVLKNKQATVWDNQGAQQALIEQFGALYTGEDVTVDGMIVTANGPAAADAFGRTFAEL